MAVASSYQEVVMIRNPFSWKVVKGDVAFISLLTILRLVNDHFNFSVVVIN